MYVEADVARRPTPQMVADGVDAVPALSAARLWRRGQSVSGAVVRRVRQRVRPAGRRPHRAGGDSQLCEQAGADPPIGAVFVATPAAISWQARRQPDCSWISCAIFRRAHTTTARTRSKWRSALPKTYGMAATATTDWGIGCQWAHDWPRETKPHRPERPRYESPGAALGTRAKPNSKALKGRHE